MTPDNDLFGIFPFDRVSTTMRVAPDPSSLGAVLTAAERIAAWMAWPEEFALQMQLVVEEATLNSLSYSQATDPIQIECVVRKNTVTIRIVDNGVPFDPTDAEPLDLDATLFERQLGGMGIHIIRNYAESFQYTRYNNENRLTLKMVN